MLRIAASSEKTGRQLLNAGLKTEEQPVSHLTRLAATKIVQEEVEEEVSDYLELKRCERWDEGQQGPRNSNEPRHIHSAEGEIVV